MARSVHFAKLNFAKLLTTRKSSNSPKRGTVIEEGGHPIGQAYSPPLRLQGRCGPLCHTVDYPIQSRTFLRGNTIDPPPARGYVGMPLPPRSCQMRQKPIYIIHIQYALILIFNIFDKGYRCIVAALSAGGHKCLQSFFAQSDQRYSSNEVLYSGAAAASSQVRQRAIRPTCKHLVGGLKRGAAFQPFDFDLLADL
jgi:hypothetical protein